MQTTSYAGSNYNIPNTRGDRPWSGLSDFVIAAAAKCINTAGGNFTLLADINLGASFGLVSTYYKSRTSTIATAGTVRLANATDSISWRNALDNGNLSLTANAANQLQFNLKAVPLEASSLTASRLVLTDSSSDLVTNSVTTTEAGYLSGVTSAIQTQLNAKQATGNYITALTGDVTASGPNSVAATLATVNASPGATTISSVTTNGKGLVTANTSASTTGSGNVVLSTSPTLVTPVLGTPSSGTLSACTGLSLTSGVTGTLPVANGGTGVTASTGTVANVLSTSPTLVTPILGVAAATSINFGGTALSTYAEGTFTPVLNFGGATTGITYGTQTGRYTRIGRMVQYEVRITLTSKGSATGSATITGLPFAAASRAYATAFVSVMSAGVTNANVEIDTSTAFLDILSAGTQVALSNAEFTNTSTFNFTGTYSA